MDRVTFATSSAIAWLDIAVHLAAGMVSIPAETIAFSVAMGGRRHGRSGQLFAWALVAIALTTAGIGASEHRPGRNPARQ